MQDTSRGSAPTVEVAHLLTVAEALASVSSDDLARVLEVLVAARDAERRIYVLGNGGSSSTAAHFVCDFGKTAAVDHARTLRIHNLSDNVPMLTAIGNDVDYDSVFSRQLSLYLDPGDVVIAISASGNSPNVLAAIRVAKERGATTVGLFGFNGGRGLALVDVPLLVAYHDYGVVEDVHMAIGHALTRALREYGIEGRR